MEKQKDHIQRIQELTFEAYKTSGRIAVLLDEDGGPSEALARELERIFRTPITVDESDAREPIFGDTLD